MRMPWQILVVDDEPDVITISTMALKNKHWLGRRFAVTGAASAREARELLSQGDRPNFQIALVDVMMETDDAGLRLCEYIRETQDLSLRIILRTGAAGRLPKESVLNEYDIDY